MMKHTDPERVFAGLEVPGPPDELHNLVVSRARAAFLEGARWDLWTRLWEHPVLRVAWAASVGLLIIAHLGMSVQPGSTPTVVTSQPSYQIEEIIEATRLPRLRLDVASVGVSLDDELTPGDRPSVARHKEMS
jgi:hypothetical protein